MRGNCPSLIYSGFSTPDRSMIYKLSRLNGSGTPLLCPVEVLLSDEDSHCQGGHAQHNIMLRKDVREKENGHRRVAIVIVR